MSQDPWFGVEVRHLAALSAVASESSFRGAADRLGYVQSAVSQQIAGLERLVGVRLVERSRGSKEIELTEAGELLLGHADEILARLRAAQADLARRSNGGRDGRLVVGVFPSVAVGFLPTVLRRLAVTAPDLRVVPIETPGDAALFELVERGEIEVAFGELPLETGPFKARKILRDPYALLAPSGSGWTERDSPPTAEELARLPLIGLDGGRPAASLEKWFAAHGLAPNIVLHSDNEATVRAFVAAGLGAAVVPRLGIEQWDTRFAVIDLAGLVPARELAMFWHGERQHGRELEAFCEVAVRTGREMADRRRKGDEAQVRLALSRAA